MTKKEQAKILDWIYENHQHHEGSRRSEMSLDTGESIEYPGDATCEDGNSPYVNSMELEKFIKSLVS